MTLYNFVYTYEITEDLVTSTYNSALPLKATSDLSALSESIRLAEQLGGVGVAVPHFIGGSPAYRFRLLGWHIVTEIVNEDDYKI